MNDFDRFLETQLRHMLDPVVAASAPPRGLRRKREMPPRLVIESSVELVPEVIAVAEPVVVAVPAAAPQL